MPEIMQKLMPIDPVWSRVCEEALAAVANEPLMGGLYIPACCTTPRWNARWPIAFP